MGQDKILELFFEFPNKRFSIREISKIVRIPRSTVHKRLIELRKNKLIDEKNIAINSEFFKIKKITYFLEKIVSCGLINFLVKELNPSCIILFGSIRKGDSVKESDIDIFVESPINKKIDLKKYEKKLNHEIQLFVESSINNLHKNLFNNVINGIKLFGSLKLK